MKKEESESKGSSPIVIEQPGMRMTVEYRHTPSDKGLTFDITVAGGREEGKRILRFDCFNEKPHYHIGPSTKHPVHDMKEEGIEDPVRWTLDQLKTRLPSLVVEAGYEEIADRIDQKAIADRLCQLENEILAKRD